MSFATYRVSRRNQGRYSEYSGSGNRYVHPEAIPALPGEKRNEWLWEIKSEFLFGQLMLSFSPCRFNHKEPLSLQKAVSVTVYIWLRGSLSPCWGGGRWSSASPLLLKECGVIPPAGRPRTWALLPSFSTRQCFEDFYPENMTVCINKTFVKILTAGELPSFFRLDWYKQGRHWENSRGARSKIKVSVCRLAAKPKINY